MNELNKRRDLCFNKVRYSGNATNPHVAVSRVHHYCFVSAKKNYATVVCAGKFTTSYHCNGDSRDVQHQRHCNHWQKL